MVSPQFQQKVSRFRNSRALAITEKSHVSKISYKAYMGKTVICCTLAMSTVIIVLYSCMVTTCPYVHMYVQECLRTQDPPQYMSRKNLVSYGQTLFWHRTFIACSISTWPYHATQLIISADLFSRLTIACNIICYIQLATTFTLNFGVCSYIATCCSYMPL